MSNENNDARRLLAFGSSVREVRDEAGWSQERLAAECGLDRTYVSGVERGVRNIGLLNMLRIADALGVEVSRLVAFHRPPAR